MSSKWRGNETSWCALCSGQFRTVLALHFNFIKEVSGSENEFKTPVLCWCIQYCQTTPIFIFWTRVNKSWAERQNSLCVCVCRVIDSQNQPKREYTPKPRPAFDFAEVNQSNGGYALAATSPPAYSPSRFTVLHTVHGNKGERCFTDMIGKWQNKHTANKKQKKDQGHQPGTGVKVRCVSNV